MSLTETEKACYLAFYHLIENGAAEFTARDVVDWFTSLGLSPPNQSRLASNLRSSRVTFRGSRSGTYRLHRMFVHGLREKFSSLLPESEEVLDDGTVLPPSRYENTRGFIEALARQINACYEKNLFDGCAVLMRRLVEILLILAYEHVHLEAEIKDSGSNYVMLDAIIDKVRANTTLALSRNTKSSLEHFRKLGNFSAHKIYYNCKRAEIQPVILDFRAMVEELLYKAGIKT